MKELFYARVDGRVVRDCDGNPIGDPGHFRIVCAHTGETPTHDDGKTVAFVEINTLGGWAYVVDRLARTDTLLKIYGDWKLYLIKTP